MACKWPLGSEHPKPTPSSSSLICGHGMTTSLYCTTVRVCTIQYCGSGRVLRRSEESRRATTGAVFCSKFFNWLGTMKVLLQPPLKPGEYAGSRETKLVSSSQGRAHRYPKALAASAELQSCQKEAMATVRPSDFQKAFHLRSQSPQALKKAEYSAVSLCTSFPALRSLQSSSFVKPSDEIQRLIAANARSTVTGPMDVREIPVFYRQLLGPSTPEWAVRRLCKALEAKHGTLVSFDQIAGEVENISVAISASERKRTGKPEWVLKERNEVSQQNHDPKTTQAHATHLCICYRTFTPAVPLTTSHIKASFMFRLCPRATSRTTARISVVDLAVGP